MNMRKPKTKGGKSSIAIARRAVHKWGVTSEVLMEEPL